MRVYILGNPLLPSDFMPLKMIGQLQKAFPDIEFKELDPSEELPDEKVLVFIDTTEGNDDVRVLEDLDRICEEPRYSLHDFGLGTHLKLMRKLGKLEKVAVICIPQSIGYEDALRKVKGKLIGLKSSLS